jgi:hypothetical protein
MLVHRACASVAIGALAMLAVVFFFNIGYPTSGGGLGVSHPQRELWFSAHARVPAHGACRTR